MSSQFRRAFAIIVFFSGNRQVRTERVAGGVVTCTNPKQANAAVHLRERRGASPATLYELSWQRFPTTRAATLSITFGKTGNVNVPGFPPGFLVARA